MIQKICALGARVLDSDKWMDECTHVIVSSFIMSEKIMAAVAAGRWVLDNSFVEKNKMIQKICALGAMVIESDEWKDECTHVIVSSFIMSEKIMAAVAAGRWVLDNSFV